jgi:hypothetical protein
MSRVRALLWLPRAVTIAGALAGLLGCAACGTPNPIPPEDEAKSWAKKLEIPARGAACTTVDSDDDGYVSCVLAINRGDAVPIYQGLQCAELGSRKAGGCKPDSKNPKVDIVDWKSGMPTCPPCPECAATHDGGR